MTDTWQGLSYMVSNKVVDPTGRWITFDDGEGSVGSLRAGVPLEASLCNRRLDASSPFERDLALGMDGVSPKARASREGLETMVRLRHSLTNDQATYIVNAMYLSVVDPVRGRVGRIADKYGVVRILVDERATVVHHDEVALCALIDLYGDSRLSQTARQPEMVVRRSHGVDTSVGRPIHPSAAEAHALPSVVRLRRSKDGEVRPMTAVFSAKSSMVMALWGHAKVEKRDIWINTLGRAIESLLPQLVGFVDAGFVQIATASMSSVENALHLIVGTAEGWYDAFPFLQMLASAILHNYLGGDGKSNNEAWRTTWVRTAVFQVLSRVVKDNDKYSVEMHVIAGNNASSVTNKSSQVSTGVSKSDVRAFWAKSWIFDETGTYASLPDEFFEESGI
jgi:hypothetical protein